MDELKLILLGWLLGLLSSLVSGIALFWLEGKRANRNKTIEKREANIRAALNWSNSDKKESFRGCDLMGANLSGVDLSDADFTDANFANAILSGTNFSNSKLDRANFFKANLNGANFWFSSLVQADFKKAKILNASFDNAVLHETKLKKAINVDNNHSWILAKIDETTELPKELLIKNLHLQELVEKHPEEFIAILEEMKKIESESEE